MQGPEDPYPIILVDEFNELGIWPRAELKALLIFLSWCGLGAEAAKQPLLHVFNLLFALMHADQPAHLHCMKNPHTALLAAVVR